MKKKYEIQKSQPIEIIDNRQNKIQKSQPVEIIDTLKKSRYEKTNSNNFFGVEIEEITIGEIKLKGVKAGLQFGKNKKYK